MNDQGDRWNEEFGLWRGERTEERVSNAKQLGSLLQQGYQANLQIA